MSSNKAIGIDLGTTNSCVAIYRDGKVEIIPNDHGKRTTPSAILFTESERFIGDSAFEQVGLNHKNLVFDVKRLIGRRFDDVEMEEDINSSPFSISEHCSMIVIEVDYRGVQHSFTPEELSAMVLRQMKTIAENYLKEDVTDAVITVPAYFNDGQRQATKDAATIAGLNPIRIINEPTAAALAYGLENGVTGEKNVLVFDLGGGTFDVSIVNITKGPTFEVKATTGDTHLGGVDFDQKLLQYFVNEISTKHFIDISTDSSALLRLRKACEETKKRLSNSQEASIEIDGLVEGLNFVSKITALQFEEMCKGLFERTLQTVENALNDAGLKKEEIDDIVLVGGSTRIPKIQKMLKEFFDGKDLKYSINPDEAVAHGAAVQAALLVSPADLNSSIKSLSLLDVTPLSLGTSVVGDLMSVLIPRNTRIPVKVSEKYTTSVDNQTHVLIDVYEGERTNTADNNKLGEFLLTGFPPAPRGTACIDVTFKVNSDGILTVSAVETATGTSSSVVIKNEQWRLSEREIERMIKEAQLFAIEDNMHREKIESRNNLESYAYKINQCTVEYKEKLSTADYEMAQTVWADVLKWIKTNESADKKTIDSKFAEVHQCCEPIMLKLYGVNKNGTKTFWKKLDEKFKSIFGSKS